MMNSRRDQIPTEELLSVLQKEFPAGKIGTTAAGITKLVSKMDADQDQVQPKPCFPKEPTS
jgi:hypothetical protein